MAFRLSSFRGARKREPGITCRNFCIPRSPAQDARAPRNDAGTAKRRLHIGVAVRADRGDAQHVGGAGSAERHAGDDDDALAGPGKTVAKGD